MSTLKRNGATNFWDESALPLWLFLGALGIYLATRLIGLDQFPIYFFTDEANQTQSIARLVEEKYRLDDVFLPTYFANGLYYNLGLSVYIQWLPFLLFGKSAVITRATSALITLISAASAGLIMRDIYKAKYWWTGVLFLSITPAWFLHSRTAFETAEFVSFYAGALYAYLLYRCRSPRYLYAALVLSACAFYTYSPAQIIVVLTAFALAISDFGYHLDNPRVLRTAIPLTLILAFPYLRFIFQNPHIPLEHLDTLGSYWVSGQSDLQKLSRYLSEYAVGLSPWYWYVPNTRDLPRHLMKGYGHILPATLPLAIIGMASLLRNLRQPANRAVLIAMLASPSAAALVGVGITRSLSFVIPACIVTAIGFEKLATWISAPGLHPDQPAPASAPPRLRPVPGLLILSAGAALALAFPSSPLINRISLGALALILAAQISGADEWLACRTNKTKAPSTTRRAWPNHISVALAAFTVLSGANLWALTDALRNGPTWYNDYGLGGMQYGAFQIFDEIEQYRRERPGADIMFSPDWANGADVLVHFFMGYPPPIKIGSIRGHLSNQRPLDDSMTFVVTPAEYNQVLNNPKFADLQTDKIVPYPNGQPGFYFIRLRYSAGADELFAAEAAARRRLEESTLTLNGEAIQARHSRLEGESQEKSIALLFDGDPLTMAKTESANPFVVELTFPSPRQINGFSIVIGATSASITLTGYAYEGAPPIAYKFAGRATLRDPELTFNLPAPMTVLILRIEKLDPYANEPAKNHLWEITLR